MSQRGKRERMIRRAEVVLSRGDRFAWGFGLIPWRALSKSERRVARARYHDRARELVDALLSDKEPV